MGLDIYLYKVKSPDLDITKIHEFEELQNRHIYTFKKDECGSLPTTIINVANRLKVKCEYYNLEKIEKKIGKGKLSSLHPSGWCNGDVTFSGTVEKTKESVSITILEDELPDYIYSQVNKLLACEFEEIAYQRKGLNDKGWALLPDNCAYDDDKSRIEEMCNVGGLSEDFRNNWVDGETVFWAWW